MGRRECKLGKSKQSATSRGVEGVVVAQEKGSQSEPYDTQQDSVLGFSYYLLLLVWHLLLVFVLAVFNPVSIGVHNMQHNSVLVAVCFY